MENVWIWNALPTILLAVIGWLLLRFIKNYDLKIEEVNQKTENNSKRLHEIENTNVNKVDDLKKMVLDSEHRLLKKIEAVIEDKNNLRITQTIQMTRVETKTELIIGTLKEIKDHVFKNR